MYRAKLTIIIRFYFLTLAMFQNKEQNKRLRNVDLRNDQKEDYQYCQEYI